MRSQHRHQQHFHWKTTKCLSWLTLVVVFTSAAAKREYVFPPTVQQIHRQDESQPRQLHTVETGNVFDHNGPNGTSVVHDEDSFLERTQNKEDLFLESIALPVVDVQQDEEDLYLEGTGLPLDMEIVLLTFGFVSCIISIIGSACIIYMCYRDLDKVMQRLLFLLSISDLITSLTILMMPFLLPPNVSIVAFGSFASCSAMGFIYSAFILIGGCYNMYLSVYYLAVVRYNWKEPTPQYGERAKMPRWEILVHVFTVGIPFAYSSVVASTESFSPHQFLPFCQIGSYPWGCVDDPNDSLECERTSYEVVVRFGAFYALYLGIVTLVGLACSGAVYFTVRNKLKVSIQKSFTSRIQKGPGSAAINMETNYDENDPFKKRIIQVRTQSILYSMSYLNTYVWGLVIGLVMVSGMTSVEIHAKKSEPGLYALQLMAFTFMPLQGAFNFFVFTRQKTKRWREADPDLSVWTIWRHVLANTEIPTPSQVKARKRREEQKKVRAAKSANGEPSDPIDNTETCRTTNAEDLRS